MSKQDSYSQIDNEIARDLKLIETSTDSFLEESFVKQIRSALERKELRAIVKASSAVMGGKRAQTARICIGYKTRCFQFKGSDFFEKEGIQIDLSRKATCGNLIAFTQHSPCLEFLSRNGKTFCQFKDVCPLEDAPERFIEREDAKIAILSASSLKELLKKIKNALRVWAIFF